MEAGLAIEDKRSEQRVAAAGRGMIKLKDVHIPAELGDVSPGGCKLRIQPEIMHIVEKMMPVEVALEFAGRRFDATIVWSAKGLLGCRFARQLPLSDVAELMASRRQPLGR
jgi:hypothetical protein